MVPSVHNSVAQPHKVPNKPVKLHKVLNKALSKVLNKAKVPTKSHSKVLPHHQHPETNNQPPSRVTPSPPHQASHHKTGHHSSTVLPHKNNKVTTLVNASKEPTKTSKANSTRMPDTVLQSLLELPQCQATKPLMTSTSKSLVSPTPHQRVEFQEAHQPSNSCNHSDQAAHSLLLVHLQAHAHQSELAAHSVSRHHHSLLLSAVSVHQLSHPHSDQPQLVSVESVAQPSLDSQANKAPKAVSNHNNREPKVVSNHSKELREVSSHNKVVLNSSNHRATQEHHIKQDSYRG